MISTFESPRNRYLQVKIHLRIQCETLQQDDGHGDRATFDRRTHLVVSGQLVRRRIGRAVRTMPTWTTQATQQQVDESTLPTGLSWTRERVRDAYWSVGRVRPRTFGSGDGLRRAASRWVW